MSGVVFQSIGNGAVAVDIDALKCHRMHLKLFREEISIVGAKNKAGVFKQALQSVRMIADLWALCEQRLVEWQSCECRDLTFDEVQEFVNQFSAPFKGDLEKQIRIVEQHRKTERPFEIADVSGAVLVPIDHLDIIDRTISISGYGVRLFGSQKEWEEFDRTMAEIDTSSIIRSESSEIFRSAFHWGFIRHLSERGNPSLKDAHQLLQDYGAFIKARPFEQLRLLQEYRVEQVRESIDSTGFRSVD